MYQLITNRLCHAQILPFGLLARAAVGKLRSVCRATVLLSSRLAIAASLFIEKQEYRSIMCVKRMHRTLDSNREEVQTRDILLTNIAPTGSLPETGSSFQPLV